MEDPEDQECLSKGSQEYFETVCEPCCESDNLVKAHGYCVVCKEYMCKQCIKSHKGMKISRDHHIQGPGEMTETKPGSYSDAKDDLPSHDELNIKCKQHKGEVIRYFCKKHKVVGCVDCITFSHRSCVNIVRVSEVSSDASVVTELDEFDRRLKTITEGIRNILQMSEEKHLHADDQKEKLLQDIRHYKEAITETLNNLVTKIEAQVKCKIMTDHSKIDQLKMRSKTLQEEVEKTSNEFDSLKESNQKTKEFILMNQTQHQLVEWEKEWNAIVASDQPNQSTQYSFCPDLNLRHVLRKVSEFGQFVGKDDAGQCEVCKKMTVRTHIHELICGHYQCGACTEGSDEIKRTCSTCGKVTGNQPPGSLREWTEKENSYRIEVLEFKFPDGIQEAFHPYPGKTYKGDTLTCRLYRVSNSEDVYRMLKTAFDRKLVCRIEQDKIVSNIELYQGKVIMEGGYPAWYTREYESYIIRVMEQLKKLGITG